MNGIGGIAPDSGTAIVLIHGWRVRQSALDVKPPSLRGRIFVLKVVVIEQVFVPALVIIVVGTVWCR